jgi:hypothetical protein
MAIIKPEQLRSGSYSISGSFSGSFQGDGSDLTNVTASFIPVGLGGIYGGNGTVPLNTTASINGDFTFQGLDEDTRLIVRDGNNGSAIHLFSDGPSGQSGVEFRTQTTDSLLHRIQIAGGDTRYQANQRDLVFSTSTSSLSSGIFITASNGNVGIGTVIPNYKLDVVGTGNISEDLFVRDTIYVGNVTGTPITNASLYIRQPSITGSSESPIIDIQVDDANSYFRINNATATDGFFTPSIITRQSDSPDRLSLFFDALVEDAQDTPGAADVMRFRARRDTPDFIQNRNLYAWYNYTTRLMDLDKDGNLRLFQGGLTVNGNTTITGSVDVLNGNVNITSNAYFFQGTDTGGTNVSLIGVNSSDQIYIGNQGFTNIIADSTIISGSLNVTAGITGSYTGSFVGDGNGLFNIPASGIVGLNLSQIVSGSVSASISPDSGLQINTNVTATSFTGSLSGTASFAQTASYVETAQTASYVLQAVSSSFASSGIGEFTGSFSGSFVGDGSQLTGIISSKWSGSNPITRDSDVEITGSFNVEGQTTLFTTGSGTLTVQGSGSDQPIFTVQGSSGELFSITDNLSGSLFSVNDISGLPILEVFSDNTVLIGDYQAPALYTTKRVTSVAGNNVIYSLTTSSYDGAFFDYVAKSGSNARAGNIMALWSGTSVNFTETTTTDFGSTSGLAFTVFISGSNLVLSGSTSTANWNIKTIIRSI